jgi:RNA 3'-terminal phosphate cyclase (ATP)
MKDSVITIDGGALSGSGTIVRYSVVLSCLLKKKLQIDRIRAKRDKPGLMPQHLKAIQACADLTNATAEGLFRGSQAIVFAPVVPVQSGLFSWDIGTAGSTTLMSYCLLPLGCFGMKKSMYSLTGGVFQDFAPNAFHFNHVLLPLLKRLSVAAELRVTKPGYYPKGGGLIELSVEPIRDTLKPIKMIRQGDIVRIRGIAIASHLKKGEVAKRIAAACQETLAKQGLSAQIEIIDDETAHQKGAALCVWATTDEGCIIGADKAGKLGRTSESIGNATALQLLEDIQTGATVDRFVADQLILFASLADGQSEFIAPMITDHVTANCWLVENMLGAKTSIDGQLLTIQGVGLSR